MSDRNPFTDEAELADALRRHYRSQVDGVDFEPISADDIRAAAKPPSQRPRWLLAAAAAIIVIALAVIPLVLTQLTQGGVTAQPATVSPTESATARGQSPTWSPRLPSPVDVTGYAQAVIDDSVYLLAGITGGTCRLDAYRYRSGPDLWQQLAVGPKRPTAACASVQVFASGTRIYLLIDAGDGQDAATRSEFYAFDTEDDTWTKVNGPRLQGRPDCTAIGLSDGIFCLDAASGTGSNPVGFAQFDFTTRTWTSATIQLAGGQARLSVGVHGVNVAGDDQILLDARLPGGAVVLALWDPAADRVSQQFSHPGTGAALAEAQLADGRLFFAPPADPAAQGLAGSDPRGTTGLILDLNTGQWSSVEVPHPAGPLTMTTPSDGSWALRLYGPDASGYVLVNGYLFQPRQNRWLAVAPLPAVERGSEPHLWVGGSVLCRTSDPLNCWGLDAGPLAQVARPVTAAQISSSNAQVR